MTDCPQDRLCRKCDHYCDEIVDMYCWNDRCRRLQTKTCDPIYGGYNYHGKLLWCFSEREEGKIILEYIFGENKNKCGKEGCFWEAKKW